MSVYVIGITGASGVVYGKRTVQALLELGHHVKLIVSPAADRVMDIEMGIHFTGSRHARLQQWRELVDATGDALELLPHRDFAASVASGSFPLAGMAVVPCSMGTLARIAGGMSTNLIERAADVALKERRRLVLVPRETPLSRIHLQNMLTVMDAGAEIVPAMPGFYHQPRGIDDIVDMMAGRILDRLGVENDLFKRWQGDPLSQLVRDE